MDQSSFIDLMGYLGGIFLMISFLPQVIKTWKSREADQISIFLLVLTLLSGVFYNIYAYMLDLIPVIVMNTIFIVLVAIQLVFTLRFRKNSTAQSPGQPVT